MNMYLRDVEDLVKQIYSIHESSEMSDVTSMVDLLENSWSNPFHQDPSDLINLSTGAVATPEISNDIFKAHEKGEEAYQNFRVQRLEKGEGFYDTLKKT